MSCFFSRSIFHYDILSLLYKKFGDRVIFFINLHSLRRLQTLHRIKTNTSSKLNKTKERKYAVSTHDKCCFFILKRNTVNALYSNLVCHFPVLFVLQHTHYELDLTIKYSFQKLATLAIDTLLLDLFTKTYIDVIITHHTELIC